MKKIWAWVYERIWGILAILGTLVLLWIILEVHLYEDPQ